MTSSLQRSCGKPQRTEPTAVSRGEGNVEALVEDWEDPGGQARAVAAAEAAEVLAVRGGLLAQSRSLLRRSRHSRAGSTSRVWTSGQGPHCPQMALAAAQRRRLMPRWADLGEVAAS